MTDMPRTRLLSTITVAALIACGNASAEGLAKSDPLYKTIHGLDQKLFGAYNTCDIGTVSNLVADDLEFYHDKTGLSAGKAAFVSSIENNVCHKVRRELVEGAFEVYPLENYGAMEIGRHTFCNLVETPTCAPETNGDGKFVMLWHKEGDTYKLSRVISYDHVSSWQRQGK